MANVIELITVTDSVLTGSNIAENDGPEWDAGTTYAAGDLVIQAATHSLYESAVSGNTGNDPSDGDVAFWLPLGSTNRWRAFDQKTGQQSSQAGDITFELTLPSICTGLALFEMAALSVRVEIVSGGDTLYDETQDLVDSTEIVNFFTYFTYAPEYKPDAVFEDLPGYAGSTVTITLDGGGGSSSVGEIGVGRLHRLGTSLSGAKGSRVDLSVVERNDYGNVTIIDRGYYKTLTLPFVVPVGGELNVERVLDRIGSKPCVLYPSADLINRIAPVYGKANEGQRIYASAGVSEFEIEIESMV